MEVAPVAPIAPQPNGAAKVAPVSTPPIDSKAKPETPEEAWEFNEDGKTVKLTKTEAQKRFAEGSHAKKRLQQAADDAKALRAEQAKAKEEREADAKLRKENRAEWLKKNELDEDTLAREVLERKLREQEMTPDQKRAEKAERERDELKKTDEANKAEKRAAEVTQTGKHITEWMIDGLNRAAAAAKLNLGPREKFIAYEVADEFGKAGVPLSPEWAPRVIEAAKQRVDESFQRLEADVTAGLTGEALANRLGKRVVDELLKYRLEQIRGKKTFGVGKPAVEPPPIAKPSKYISLRDAEAELRKASKL